MNVEGMAYLKQDYKFNKFLLNSKFINKIDFLLNICIRVTIRLMPNKIRELFYEKILRSKINK